MSERNQGILNTVGYSYNDLTVVPAVISSIVSRKECGCIDDVTNKLPIFTAPMLSVVNEYNYDIWCKNDINAIIPRSVKYAKRIEFLHKKCWVALSLNEFEKLFVKNPNISDYTSKKFYVCVDLANGHMQKVYDVINEAKNNAHEYGFVLTVMTGNVANPQTYEWICKNAKVDYIRLSIGSGAGCLTTSNTATHYPIATLIDECKKIKDDITLCYLDDDSEYLSLPHIVADGGIRNYSDVVKALALGADYVMIGSLLAGLLESSADMVIESNDPVKYPVYYDRNTGETEYYINYDESETVHIWNGDTEEKKRELIRSMKSITKKFIGMSTKEAQIVINSCLENPIIANKQDLKTSEGCTKFIPCKYTIAQWVENMVDYLRSAMSYTDCRTLYDFKNNVYLIPNSPSEIYAVNK